MNDLAARLAATTKALSVLLGLSGAARPAILRIPVPLALGTTTWN